MPSYRQSSMHMEMQVSQRRKGSLRRLSQYPEKTDEASVQSKLIKAQHINKEHTEAQGK